LGISQGKGAPQHLVNSLNTAAHIILGPTYKYQVLFLWADQKRLCISDENQCCLSRVLCAEHVSLPLTSIHSLHMSKRGSKRKKYF